MLAVDWGAIGAIAAVVSLLWMGLLIPLARWGLRDMKRWLTENVVAEIKAWLIENIEALVAKVVHRDVTPRLDDLARRMDDHNVRIARLEGIEQGKRAILDQQQQAQQQAREQS